MPPPRRQYYVYGIAASLLGLIAGIVGAEVAVRQGIWQPPRQVVRGFGLHDQDGVPVWEQATDRQNRACVELHPDRTRIMFFGSSITFGVGLEAAQVFTAALEARLNQVQSTPGFCVLNFAQPGFSFEQKLAIARVEVPRYRPALIMWENWVEWTTYRLLGDTAFALGDLRIRDDGFVGIAGVPDAPNRFLFLNSRLYQYLVLTAGERTYVPNGIDGFVNQRLIKASALAQSVGAKLVLYLAPPLDQPFVETAAKPPDWHEQILAFTRAHNIPTFPLQSELRDQDYLALRLDPCCHFNAAGHRALVSVMERIVLAQLDVFLDAEQSGESQWGMRQHCAGDHACGSTYRWRAARPLRKIEALIASLDGSP